jgi:hypothetical protein
MARSAWRFSLEWRVEEVAEEVAAVNPRRKGWRQSERWRLPEVLSPVP